MMLELLHTRRIAFTTQLRSEILEMPVPGVEQSISNAAGEAKGPQTTRIRENAVAWAVLLFWWGCSHHT